MKPDRARRLARAAALKFLDDTNPSMEKSLCASKDERRGIGVGGAGSPVRGEPASNI
jgi:hypothetical protein